MKNKKRARLTLTFAACAISFVLVSLPAWGQAPAVTPAQPAVQSDTSWVVIPLRPQDQIQADLQVARSYYDNAKIRHSKALEGQVLLDPLIASRQAQIDSLKKGQDLAKKEKREVDATAFEVAKKAAEQIRDMLVEQKELRTAELEATQAEVEWSEAAQKALESEMELARKCDERKAVAPGGGTQATGEQLDLLIREIQTRTLEGQRVQADKLNKMAEKQKEVTDRRLKFSGEIEKFKSGK